MRAYPAPLLLGLFIAGAMASAPYRAAAAALPTTGPLPATHAGTLPSAALDGGNSKRLSQHGHTSQRVSQKARVAVNFSPIANLTYQLDCVSGAAISCSSNDFRALWAREFLKTPSDSARLSEWRRVRDRYEQNVALPMESADSAPLLPTGTNSLSLSHNLRMAGFQAASVDDYTASLDLVVTTDDRATLAAVVRHFQPRFDAWWHREAAVRGAPFVQRVDALMHDPRIADQLSAFATFYEASLSTSDTLEFTLLYRPTLVTEDARGEQTGRYALVEFLPDEQADERMNVVVHELCQYLMRRAPRPHARSLYTAFITSKDPNAIPAYNFLEETLATAFGNGMIARTLHPTTVFAAMLKKPMTLCNNELIDRGAKMLIPWLDQWLASGRTLYDPTFAPEYLARVDREFGSSLRAPRLMLNRMVLFADSGYTPIASRIVERAFMVSAAFSSNTLEEYRSRPNMAALLVIHPNRLESLVSSHVLSKDDAARLRSYTENTGSALFTRERSRGVYTFMIVARDTADVRTQVALLAQQSSPSLGISGIARGQ